MATRSGAGRPPLVTNARKGRSLDADERNRRYLATMAVRVACFLAGAFSRPPWMFVFFGLAAILPGIAVILANAIDKRSAPPAAAIDAEPVSRLELTPGLVVPGEVLHEEEA